ncbi:MAG: hypothetical protein HKP27_11715 [Myxococcales bacterium]|nr:hypothetical protein [Myxococcales bacterium]
MSRRDDERPKLSFSERDRLLKEKKQGYGAPRGRAAEERAKAATDEALKQASDLFAAGKGGAEGKRLADAVQEARGSAGFAQACSEYVAGLGAPSDPKLASAFLDADAVPVLKAGLEGLLTAKADGNLVLDRGLRSRLRMLAEHADDDVAYGAEELLAEQ